MRQRGLTLIELLVAVAMMGLLTAASVRAFVAGMQTEQRLRDGMTQDEKLATFERQLDHLVSQAYLSTDTTDAASYFVGQYANGAPAIQQNQGLEGTGCDMLTFTVIGIRPSSNVIESTDDFETNNQKLGPQGGMTEVELSLQPYDAPGNEQGLFLREQHPADGDLTQGGRQRVLNADVAEIQFMFYDGANWQSQWDTRSQSGTPRLPAAVQIRYKLQGETDFRVLTVRLRHSDVTPTNPVTVGSGQ